MNLCRLSKVKVKRNVCQLNIFLIFLWFIALFVFYCLRSMTSNCLIRFTENASVFAATVHDS